MPKLQVRVGHSLDSLQPIPINTSVPFQLKSDAFDGQVSVHVRNHEPPSAVLPPTAPDSFCLFVQGRFLKPHPLCADDILFGNKFERPLKLPVGTSMALAFARWFDPGLEANLYGNQPQAFSPLVVTMNQLAIHTSANPLKAADAEAVGQEGMEDVSVLVQGLGTAAKRRKYFADPMHRKAVKVTPDQTWSMAFMNPYIDFNKFVIHLPMMDINVLKYWDGQPLCYYAKTRDDSTIFFIIEFNLV